MGNLTDAILHMAGQWNHRHFSEAKYGKSPYCASFVRWCYEKATGTTFGLPMVTRVPYYQRKGIHVAPGMWFADSLAGDEVGPVVNSQRPGDLLFFHDTADGPWPRGSITHVGIAADTGDRIWDAGSGSLVWHRSHNATFPGKLVEIRRPRVLGASTSDSKRRSAITIANGKAFAMHHGAPARMLTVQFMSPTAPASLHGGGAGPRGGVGIGGGGAGHMRPTVEPKHPAGQQNQPRRWIVSINDKEIRPRSAEVDIEFGSQRFKLFGHDHRAQAFMNGARANDSIIRVVMFNGGAHVWVDGKEVKTAHAKIEIGE